MSLFDRASMAQTQQPKVKRPSFKERFRGIKTEMKKVVWPTRQELGAYTVAVVVVCAFFALGFWLIDLGVLGGLKVLLGITV